MSGLGGLEVPVRLPVEVKRFPLRSVQIGSGAQGYRGRGVLPLEIKQLGRISHYEPLTFRRLTSTIFDVPHR